MALLVVGMIIGAVVGALMSGSRKAAGDNGGPHIGDMRVQGSAVGGIIPILWGQDAIFGNIIWQGPLTEIKHEDTQSAGGKGGGSSNITNTWYSYRGSLALGICAGPLATGALKKIYANDKLLWDFDLTPALPGDIRFYLGTEIQNPDPSIQSDKGVPSTPAFRGLAYIVFENFDFNPYDNTIPQFMFELVGI